MRLLLATLSLLTLATSAQNQASQNQAPQNQIQKFPTPNLPKPVESHLNIVPLPPGECPVGFRAEQHGDGQTLWAIALEDADKPPRLRRGTAHTGVRVDLTSMAQSMRQVELSVSFLAPGSRLVPVSERPSPVPRRKTFTLSANDAPSHEIAGNLLVGATAGILRVHLLRIDYADGTSWSPSPNHGCSVEPNRFMLVDAH